VWGCVRAKVYACFACYSSTTITTTTTTTINIAIIATIAIAIVALADMTYIIVAGIPSTIAMANSISALCCYSISCAIPRVWDHVQAEGEAH
jgi:hypothetical protein